MPSILAPLRVSLPSCGPVTCWRAAAWRWCLIRLVKNSAGSLYWDKGLGASILKAGLRLWDGGTENPAAMIKIARHNLFLPTSLIHETGHQMAHILGWNEELSSALLKGLSGQHRLFDQMWAGWASEIAADAFAFVHTGYAAVAALHDVIAGDRTYVFRYIEGDPHPVTYLRVLLGADVLALAAVRGTNSHGLGNKTTLWPMQTKKSGHCSKDRCRFFRTS